MQPLIEKHIRATMQLFSNEEAGMLYRRANCKTSTLRVFFFFFQAASHLSRAWAAQVYPCVQNRHLTWSQTEPSGRLAASFPTCEQRLRGMATCRRGAPSWSTSGRFWGQKFSVPSVCMIRHTHTHWRMLPYCSWLYVFHWSRKCFCNAGLMYIAGWPHGIYMRVL